MKSLNTVDVEKWEIARAFQGVHGHRVRSLKHLDLNGDSIPLSERGARRETTLYVKASKFCLIHEASWLFPHPARAGAGDEFHSNKFDSINEAKLRPTCWLKM
jgi:hypothetical protein